MEGRRVIDETGAVHVLATNLGRGGQGEVWRTENGRRVVKLLRPTANREALRRQIGFVKRLDLQGLHVARPLAVLRPPELGYVAEFLDDMVPLRGLVTPPRGQQLVPWYVATGGLRRRLRVLAHAGEALYGLHARGLAYADLSPSNVFVSAPIDATEAWLIDLDNLRHDTSASSAVFTPWYGAPEVLRGNGNTALSDAWSFAVLVFHTLTATHPLLGDAVVEGEPELEEEALLGRFPWIEHAEDPRNRSSRGLPRAEVLGRRLFELCRRTFEDGAIAPTARPGLGEWIERLHAAADQTVRCPGCGWSYYVTAQACPECEAARPAILIVRFQRWEPSDGLVPGVNAQIPLATDAVGLTRRLTRAASGPDSQRVDVTLSLSEKGVEVRAECEDVTVTPGSAGAPRRVSNEPVFLPVNRRSGSWLIHFGALDKPHRVAVVEGA